jgi:uncharacterized membrane protein YedE/YeeE
MTDLSVDARLLASERGVAPPINTWVVILASAVLGAGAIALGDAYTWRQGALFLTGGALGVVLYHALFGFTSAWRVFIADGRGAGLRAQMLMLAVAVVLFFPTLAHGTLFGQPVHGEYGAVGVSVLVGAFLFGLGMQLGGGCASGTLYTAGGGNSRMLVTLAFFIIGSALGAWHLPWWSATPNFGPISLISTWGWAPALAVSVAGFDRAAQAWRITLWRRHRPPWLDALSARPMAASGRRCGTRHRQFRHALSRRAAVGHYVCLRAVGLEDFRGIGHRRRLLGLLAFAGARQGAQ